MSFNLSNKEPKIGELWRYRINNTVYSIEGFSKDNFSVKVKFLDVNSDTCEVIKDKHSIWYQKNLFHKDFFKEYWVYYPKNEWPKPGEIWKQKSDIPFVIFLEKIVNVCSKGLIEILNYDGFVVDCLFKNEYLKQNYVVSMNIAYLLNSYENYLSREEVVIKEIVE